MLQHGWGLYGNNGLRLNFKSSIEIIDTLRNNAKLQFVLHLLLKFLHVLRVKYLLGELCINAVYD